MFPFKTEIHQCKYSDEQYTEYIAFFINKAKDKLISISQPYKELICIWTWEESQFRIQKGVKGIFFNTEDKKEQYYLDKIIL